MLQAILYPAFLAAASMQNATPLQGEMDLASFGCEAAAGSYSSHALAGGARSLSARIALASSQVHPKWVPAAGLLFVLPGKMQYAGVQAYVLPDEPDNLVIGLKVPKSRGRPTDLAKVPLRQAVDIRATLDEAGHLTVSAGAISKTVRLKQATVVGTMLMCSSGAFTFERLSPATEERYQASSRFPR
jgi:hypothetical protein